MTTYDPREGSCQEIKDLDGKVGTNRKMSAIYFKVVGKHSHDLNGSEMYQTVCIKLQQTAVDKLEKDLEELKVRRATKQATDGDVKDAETKLTKANASLGYWKGCLELERTRKMENRCKKTCNSWSPSDSSAEKEKKRRAEDMLYQLKKTKSLKKAHETTWSEEAKKFEDKAEKLEAELKAAESKVEELHSALVNEQAANKELQAKLERNNNIVDALVAKA